MGQLGKFDHSKIERYWQEEWRVKKVYSSDLSTDKDKFYNLWMFPYPSAEGLHAGHAFASTGSDIYGRFQRMRGKQVFQPIGYDSFGIHSENYAIKINENPKIFTRRAIAHYEQQFKMMGHGYDWNYTVTTSDPDYYRWTQWLFVKLYKAGLAYKKEAWANFCPSCKTVLADEQIVTPAAAGKLPPGYNRLEDVPAGVKVCERCGSIPERRTLSQWFFRITKYADRLLDNLEKIDWPDKIKTAQRDWIGRSRGALIKFVVADGSSSIKVFTTRPDTIHGATFVVLAPELAEKYLDFVSVGSRERVREYIRESLNISEQDRKLAEKKKTGVSMDFCVVNPATKEKIPVYVADYVLMDYGTGAVMGVPAHDERDRDFAKKHDLPIRDMEPDQSYWEKMVSEGWGRRETNYHLRDWLVSRQRYWGTPIPMIHCEKCGWQPVPEDQLPVLLPDIEDFAPEGAGRGPLANHPDFYKTKCPECGGEAGRETDVMDTFVDSSWYFLRYPSVGFDSGPWRPEDLKKWLPVDLYFGGAEHAVLHLMYSRFVTMALYDLGFLHFDEPFPRFFAHGLMIKDGAKMSKSRGNVVNPDEYIEKYGADTLRLYLMFMGPMDGYPDFRDTGIEGMHKFVKRLWKLFKEGSRGKFENSQNGGVVDIKLHQTIKKVTEDIQKFKYNTAISAIMELANLFKEEGAGIEDLQILARLLAPFAPHLAEEAWVNILGREFSVHQSEWPQYNPKYIEVEHKDIVVQVNGKVRGVLSVDSQLANRQDRVEALAKGLESVSKWLSGKSYKTIFVPGKIVSFVTK